ncbi:MAG: GntG family PLP-dependent aldolase [Planctomycetota bacterium]
MSHAHDEPGIDLRSDTVTKPTPEMRAAMADAPVGDDVQEGDPTVRALETRVAEMLGTEATLFVPSGTMANLLAIRCHTQPGDEIIAHEGAHIYHWETGGYAAVAGCSIRLVPGEGGVISPETLRRAIRFDDAHCPPSRLVCIENTHNKAGGAAWPLDDLDAIADAAKAHGLRLHMDGARLWNASVAKGKPLARLTRAVDSVSVCFSKGLGAPVGSALASDAATIAAARRFRKMLGGAMRQSGVLAAAAMHALDHHLERLADDHAHARMLADAIGGCDGLALDPDRVDTNIVYARVAPDRSLEEQQRLADALASDLAGRGVGVLAEGDGRVRAVCHLGVSTADIERAIEGLRASASAVMAAMVNSPAATR